MGSSNEIIRKGRIEVRVQDGILDEVVVYEQDGNKVVLHMEMMDLNHYWLRIENTDGQPPLVLNLASFRNPPSDTSRFNNGKLDDPDSEIRGLYEWDI